MQTTMQTELGPRALAVCWGPQGGRKCSFLPISNNSGDSSLELWKQARQGDSRDELIWAMATVGIYKLWFFISHITSCPEMTAIWMVGEHKVRWGWENERRPQRSENRIWGDVGLHIHQDHLSALLLSKRQKGIPQAPFHACFCPSQGSWQITGQ